MDRTTTVRLLKDKLDQITGNSISFFEDRDGFVGNNRIEIRTNGDYRFSINLAVSAIVLSAVYPDKKYHGKRNYVNYLYLELREFHDIFTRIEDVSGETIWPEWWIWMDDYARTMNG